MKKLIILISLIACGYCFGFGGKTTKERGEIPPNILEKGPIAIGEIRRYLFDPKEVTLHFFIDGADEGKRISFLVTFSRSAEVESRAYLRVKEGENCADYRIDLGSKFVRGLAQRLRLKLPEKTDGNPPEASKKLRASRISALRALLKGNYSRKKPPE
ncbi:hypothetical protein V2O64_18535 [Verrucomicrobiaceae bacterium 227]